MKPLRLLSSLAPALHAFAEYRHALGYGDRSLQAHLVHFDRFLVQRGWSDCILTRDLVQDWVASGEALAPRTRALRLHAMRIFAQFHAQTHLESYIPGPAWGPRCQSSFRAHVYTPAEFRALLGEAARLPPPDSLRPRTYVTLLGLLYCTGLRISEALALHLADVDAEDSILWVRETKFHKSRAVPIPGDVVRALERYRGERAAQGHASDIDAPFFVNERKRPLCYPTVIATFLAIARRTGVRGAPGTRGPRLHDLRHAFAVHRLLAWYRDGGDVQACLPLLADYLGHVSIVSTQVYLQGTAELLGEAAKRFGPPRTRPSQGGTS